MKMATELTIDKLSDLQFKIDMFYVLKFYSIDTFSTHWKIQDKIFKICIFVHFYEAILNTVLLYTTLEQNASNRKN